MNEQRIAVITDTGTDTPADFVAAHDVRVVPLRINYSDGSTYESGVDITPGELVARLADEVPSTSLPSPMRIQETFEAARRDGYVGAVFVAISSGLSATYETVGMVARQMEAEGFPVVVVDTRSIGVAAGLVVMEAVRQVEAGMPLSSLGSVLAAVSERTHVFFSVQNLDFLHKGGRITDAAWRLGSMLNIKPVFTCDASGKYVVAKKARGWKRALDEEVRLAVAAARGQERVRLAVCSYDDEATLDRLEERLRSEVGAVSEVVEVLRSGISADLLVHTGPSLAGVAVMGC
ncbi:DegV family protein [Olsenella profusa]|uniref:DegV family protein n=1 Tax=Olsenella profusa TaxID=138595 RepID=A0ABS2F2I1_9ACTN|nr:DegV family protein [Olsenella profusa]MBM6775033.1 DegV family protein [Olsenella profusa]